MKVISSRGTVAAVCSRVPSRELPPERPAGGKSRSLKLDRQTDLVQIEKKKNKMPPGRVKACGTKPSSGQDVAKKFDDVVGLLEDVNIFF